MSESTFYACCQNYGTHTAACNRAMDTFERIINPTSTEARVLTDMREICVCAAIRMPDGYIVRGHRHDDCLITAGCMTRYMRAKDVLHHAEQGFLTTTGRFVDRQEGMRLMKASDAMCRWNEQDWKPFRELDVMNDMLFSENLY